MSAFRDKWQFSLICFHRSSLFVDLYGNLIRKMTNYLSLDCTLTENPVTVLEVRK